MSGPEESILRSLRRITRAIDLYSRRLSSRYGLTGPQIVCLRTVARLGPTAPSVLAREVDLSQATVTGILDRLAAQGLVARTRHTSDRRRVIVDLTEKGRQVLETAPTGLRDIFSGRLEALSEDEKTTIQQSLERVVELMQAVEVVPESSIVPTVDLVPEEILRKLAPVGEQANDIGVDESGPQPPSNPEREDVQ